MRFRVAAPAALFLALLLSGVGCLVDNEDSTREAEVLRISHWFDLDDSGRPDFRIYGGYTDNLGTSGSGVMHLWIGVPGVEGDEGNAIVRERRLVDESGEPEWKTTTIAMLEKDFSIGPSSIGSREDPAVALGNRSYWGSGGTFCRRFDDAGEKSCSGPMAGRKAYLGLRLGRGDTARYGWALLEVDTTRTDRRGIPLVLLHDSAVRDEPGQPLETGEHP